MINMSSSIATANTSASVSAMATAASNLLASLPGRDTRPQTSQPSSTSTAATTAIPAMTAQFREIHKNTWLKRLTAEGKKICVGPKVSLTIYCNLIGNYIYTEHFTI